MTMSDDRWRESGLSPYPHEREALEFVRQNLPDHDPWRAWARLQFAALDGSENEVDLLVFGKSGMFLIEIKAWEGVLDGDQSAITYGPPGSRRTAEHPMRRLKLKCDRLKSLLKAQKAFVKGEVPWIDTLVFFSHAETSRLAAPASNGVCLRDREKSTTRKAREGIVAALTQRRGANLHPMLRGKFDRPTCELVKKALEQAGIAARAERRRVEGFELGETIEESSYYRDRVGHSVDHSNVIRRVRVYCAPPGSGLSRERIDEAAGREFRVLQRLDHPGVLKALHSSRTDFGPAILFEHAANALRLDHYLDRQGAALPLDTRIDVLRQIAEAVRFAHGQDLIHRALTPESVVVFDASDPAPRIKVYNWQTSARLATDADTVHSVGSFHTTSDPSAYVESAAAAYLAPELRDEPSLSHPVLDVFSLGTIAFRLFGQAAPAESASALIRLLKDSNGLSLGAVANGVLPSVDGLVRRATHPQSTQRTQSIDEFLADLDNVEEELTRPTPPTPTRAEDVQKGVELPGGLRVIRRLGAGSIAIGLEVQRDDDTFVLKLARTPEHNDRIRREAETLRKLKHDNITSIVDEVETLGSRGILAKPTSIETLRQRLTREGPLQLEMLERFGTQLLLVLEYLVQQGVTHRDIKPDNIAVSDFGKKPQGIVLFDFSLSGTSAEDLQAGTPRYRDPFLAERDRRRWDLHAERYSAAVTLHEMATGSVPQWGDGRTSPQLAPGEIQLQSDLFPADVRSGLTRFFKQALARNAKDRFADARAMREAWERALGGSHETLHPTATPERDVTAEEIIDAAKLAGINTPLTSLPLSTRASNCVDRLGAATVEHLLRLPPRKVMWAPGVGSKTRKELDLVLTALRGAYPEVPIQVTAESLPAVPAVATTATRKIEELLQIARAHVGKRAPKSDALLDHWLGIDTSTPKSGIDLPTQLEITRRTGANQAAISTLLKKLRERWRDDPEIAVLRNELAAFLSSCGGVANIEEASATLNASHGSDFDESLRIRTSGALVRVATEAESANDPRWQLVRRAGRTLVACSSAHLDYAQLLGKEADALADQDPLPGRARIDEALAAVPRPPEVDPVSSPVLIRLATTCAKRAAFNQRLEIYPRGLAPDRALRLSLGAVLGMSKERAGDNKRAIRVEDILGRVALRYPAAAKLPDRPELDKLLAAAGVEATWSEADDAYLVRSPEDRSIVTGSSTLSNLRGRTPSARTQPQDLLQAREFSERIARTVADRLPLVLMVPPGCVDRTVERVNTEVRGLRHASIDRELVLALRERTKKYGVDWATVLEADRSGPAQQRDWTNLMQVVDESLAQVQQALEAHQGPLLLTDLGLLARYQRLDRFVTAVRDHSASANPRAVFIAIPADDQTQQPRLDGVPVPVISANQYARAPRSWLRSDDLANQPSS